MKLSSKIMCTAAVASLLVAAGARSGDAGNIPAVGGFTLDFPGKDLFGPAGQLLNVSGSSPIATWQLDNGLNENLFDLGSLGLAFPVCCTSSVPACSFVVGETGAVFGAQGQPDNTGISSVGSIQVPAPKTSGQTISYHITLQAHCGATSADLRVTRVQSDTSATTVYRVTAQ